MHYFSTACIATRFLSEGVFSNALFQRLIPQRQHVHLVNYIPSCATVHYFPSAMHLVHFTFRDTHISLRSGAIAEGACWEASWENLYVNLNALIILLVAKYGQNMLVIRLCFIR